ncbi:MAG: hypothetical protein COY75_00110 [Nitrospirae bacterium CG_4_10_14_0_8_um_filter_41_23]|nr:MAG: hypothetical protein COS27_01905 [Nitrospirae bacterium CG02_land_8_20_14_3_00_41_53]PIW86358.1 MAG: hypothetical protein COZ94_10900 [Nitrospirae bacterium CG_4_8_14_3_um_filter_41_47]PIY87950.1 MAG: hypothetical protein COY75_00110 [Nitrospirae bacterium CG_4_10_14_0_8_um_filter_41_23]PJA78758.1 MAG: hypothetical protein CO148_10655 [Nitrospirae bacterium CG_4_9_14_3_um_filter_41_27]
MEFHTFELHPQITAGVKALGYRTPTPIQCRREQKSPAQVSAHVAAAPKQRAHQPSSALPAQKAAHRGSSALHSGSASHRNYSHKQGM